MRNVLLVAIWDFFFACRLFSPLKRSLECVCLFIHFSLHFCLIFIVCEKYCVYKITTSTIDDDDHDGNNARTLTRPRARDHRNDDELRVDSFLYSVLLEFSRCWFFFRLFSSLSLNFCFFRLSYVYILSHRTAATLVFLIFWFKCAMNQMEMKWTRIERECMYAKKRIRTERICNGKMKK